MAIKSRLAFILAGGRGERFWPLSTRRRPKQFLTLVGGRPLLAETVRRLSPVVAPSDTWVITNQEYVETARGLLPELPSAQIIGEPVARDTAAAVALALGLTLARAPHAVFAVLPADHIIDDGPGFADTMRLAFSLAEREPALVVIGIKPTAPSPSFGYIEAGEAFPFGAGEVYRVRRFVEKPDEATARKYLASGLYYWNAGMFVWSAHTLLAALRRHAPRHAELAEQLADVVQRGRLAETMAALYTTIEKISIDYALMEKADNILMLPATFTWDDIGTWSALRHHFPPDPSGNVIIGDGVAEGAENNTVYSPNHFTALLGVKDLIVVHTEEVTLIARRDQADAVKKLVRRLQEEGRYEHLL